MTLNNRAKYKRTGGNTSSLHSHLKSRHADKLEAEIETTGAMDKFVTKDVPVSIYFYFYFYSLHYIFYILTNSNKTSAVSSMEKLKKYYKNTDALVYTISTSMFYDLY